MKVGPLMNYLTNNRVWLQEKCFRTPNAVPIGFIGLRRHDFINRGNYQKRVVNTIRAYLNYTNTSTLPMEQKVSLIETMRTKEIPVFSITKVTKVVKNPNYTKELDESTYNRKKT